MKSRKIRTFIPEDKSLYANPYISFPAERNIDNTKSSFDLRYNKNYKVNSKRVFNISSEYRDIDRAIKPDLLHPSTLDRILTMENQDGTTACVDLLNQTDKKYQHKKSKPKKHYYAVTKTATIAADIGIPTSEEAKVTKVLATSPMQLEKMLFKDYYGTRVGRKNSPKELHMIYNFDNWLQTRVVSEDDQSVVGRTIYYYNPSEMRPLEMNAFAKTIWTQKSVYVPVRFGTDVKPMSTSSAIVPVNDYMNQQSANFAQNVNNPPQTAQQAQQAQQPAQTAQQTAQTAQVNDGEDPLDEFLQVTTTHIRNVYSYIEKHRKWGPYKPTDMEGKTKRFRQICEQYNWSDSAIIDHFGISKDDENVKDLRDAIKNLCIEHNAQGDDERFWEIVGTKGPLIDNNRTYRYGSKPVEQPVEQPAEQQTATQAQPVQQQPVQQQPAEQQPVQQQTAQPVAQPATSVFEGTPVPTVIAPISDEDDYSKYQRTHKELINDLAKLIDSNDAFKNVLKTFAINEHIDGANTIIIIKNIVHNKEKHPEVLYTKFIEELCKNPAASKYDSDIANIEELFGEINSTPE